MSNYTKTTNFATKDSLASGNPNKIVKGTEINSEFDNIATAVATKANTASPSLTGTVTAAALNVTGNLDVDGTLEFDSISGTGSVAVTDIADEDNMSSDSATKLATQQSIKAYVDSQVTAQDLDLTDGSTSISIDLDSEALSVLGGTGVTSTASGNGVTLAIDSTVTTLTGSQTLTNKTLTSPDVNTPDIDGGTIDGTVIGGATAAAGSFTTVGATGNITVGGTVDGRDVATDGTKLDGIEASATADQSNAEIRTAVEAATDSNVFTDADHTKLNAIEASADVTDATNVTAAGALMDSELTAIASVKALNQGVATGDSPTFVDVTATSLDISGDIDVDGTTNLDVVDIDGAVDMASTLQVDGAATFTTEITANGGIALGDNDKATFGDAVGGDLQIYHDGANSYVKEIGTGSLKIQGVNLNLQSTSGESYIDCVNDGAVYVYHNNSPKLATTATGIDVTGTATMDGLSVDGNIQVNGTNAGQLTLDATGQYTQVIFEQNGSSNSGGDIIYDHTNDIYALRVLAVGDMQFKTSAVAGTALKRQNIASNGDISFYEDTGTTAKLFWDASAESLGINSSAPSTKLEVLSANGLSATNIARFASSNNAVSIGIGYNEIRQVADGNNLNFGVHSGTAMTIQDGGNVGIGTDSPNGKLTVSNGSGAHFEFFPENSTDTNLFMNYDRTSAAYQNLQTRAATHQFLIGDSEKMRIDSSGNVIVNNGGSGNGIVKINGATGNTEAVIFQRGGTEASRIGHANSADLTFSTGSGATERMRINSSGNVGINTSSPSSSNGYGTLSINGTNGGQLAFQTGGSAKQFIFSTVTDLSIYNQEAGNIKFVTNNVEAMRIDSSGNVGIGTTSPSGYRLNVSKGATGNIAQLTDGVANTFIVRSDSNTLYAGNANNYPVAFVTNNTERMRIDSSGNLLVGTTSQIDAGKVCIDAGATANGIVVDIDATGGYTNLLLDRTASDGTFIAFNRGSASVGTIGTTSGYLQVQSAGSNFRWGANNTNYLSLDANQMYPLTDNAVTLGATGVRFKDLYLSGGVYLGGTGAANKLDDYEEGTWTPTAASYDGAMTVNSASYVKVGKLVTVKAKVSFDATSDGSGVNITNLPFTTTGVGKANGGFITSSTVSSAARIQAIGTGSLFLMTADDSNVTYTTMASTSLEFVFIYEAA